MAKTEQIMLVQGDVGAEINLTLKDRSTGDSHDSKTWSAFPILEDQMIQMEIFKLPEETKVEVVNGEVLNYETGRVKFVLNASATAIAGNYRCAVRIHEGQNVRTVYDTISMYVRKRLGEDNE